MFERRANGIFVGEMARSDSLLLCQLILGTLWNTLRFISANKYAVRAPFAVKRVSVLMVLRREVEDTGP